MTNDHFRPIAGFPDYLVNQDGQVLSPSGKALKPRLVNGYHLVTLGGRQGKQLSVHQLVARTFLGDLSASRVVNHKNGDRIDNRLANLEWVTQSENVAHAYQTGLRTINDAHKARCAQLGTAKRSFTETQAVAIKQQFTGKRGEITQLARIHGISRFAVANILGR